MNETEAKIMVMCEHMPIDQRYAEYISAKLGKHYPTISSLMRRMEFKEWLRTAKSKHKRLVIQISEAALQQAKGVLNNG